MKATVTLNNWNTQKEAARFVRMHVFVVEQKIPLALEWDKMDEHCIHAVATDKAGAPIGTGRLMPDGHIGRIAVLASARGNGVGSQILQSLMQVAKERGDKRVVLSSQSKVQSFYTRFGFTAVGKEFIEAGIKHIDMEHYFKPS